VADADTKVEEGVTVVTSVLVLIIIIPPVRASGNRKCREKRATQKPPPQFPALAQAGSSMAGTGAPRSAAARSAISSHPL
jgi:hypothetical protein